MTYATRKKIPDDIRIAGLSWKIKVCLCDDTGYFNAKKRIIKIDNESDLERQWEILLHEIQEIIMVERGFCFKSYPNGFRDSSSKCFLMSHNDFRSMSKDFADAIRQIL